MRAVLDTNVLVSGLLSPSGTCGQILKLALAGRFTAVADARILAEYEEVTIRPELDLPAGSVREILDLLRRSERVMAASLDVELPDPDDLPFLEAASSSGAVLVTGNTRHFPRGKRRGVAVLTPREFLGRLASG